MKIRTVQNSASALAVLLGLTLALPAMAVDYVSVASGAWNNSANWNPVGIPGSSDTAQISSGFSITNTTGPTTLSPVTIDAGCAFIVGASCTVGGLINNGTLTMGNNSSARILTISGSFTNNGLINTPSSSPTHNIAFSGNGYWAGSGDISGVKAGVTVNGGATLDISGLTSALKVRSSGTLQLAINGTLITGAQVINGNGNGTATVTVGAAGQIITGNPNGLVNGTTGTFNLATVPSFNATSSFGFNGTSAQVTLGLASALGNLTISNAVGVTLSAPVAISGTLALDAGTLVTSVSALPTVGAAGAVSGVGFVDGPLAQVYSGVGSKTFLTGKSGNGRPVTLNYTALTGTSTVTVEQFESAMGGTLPAATTQFNNRYWTVSQSGGSGFTFDLSLDGTGFSPAATPVILRQGSPDTSYTAAVAAPSYTGTGINAFGNFALGDFTPSSDQLVITTAPQNLTAGQISATMTVQLQDSGSAPKNAASDLTITLGTTSSGGLFRNVSDTTTISSVTITAGSSSASFKYRDTVAPGTPTVTVSGGGANPGTQMETINLAAASKLAFTTPPVNGSMGVTLNQVVVQVQDAFGNNRPDSGVTVNLTLDGGTLASGTTSLATDGNGAATFADLVINQPATGLSLTVAAAGLTSATSGNFNVSSRQLVKKATTISMDQATSWVDGIVPTAFDTAVINTTSVSISPNNNSEFGASATWYGLLVNNWAAGTGYTINGGAGGTLALGPGGLVGSNVNHSLSINCALALATNELWDWSGNSGTLTLGNTVDNAGYLLTLGGNQPVTVASSLGGSGGLVKVGSNTVTVNGSLAHTGVTTVSNGVLLIAGSLSGSSAVNVAGGTLSGSGSISSPVTVQSGGTLAPRAGLATLTLSSDLTFQAGGVAAMEVNHDLASSDLVTGINQVTYAGTLSVTNLSGTAAIGDVFTLFSAATPTGNFSSIAGSPGSGLAWSFDPATGQLSVINGIATNPTNITVTVSGSTLTLAWPQDHLGWILQTQTNALSAGITTNWLDVAGSEISTNAVITINPTNPTVFFRLRSP